MASPSVVDAASEALIAQLMAEDLGELYYRHSAPIGASYDDYEEPLSSYERQCLDAENNPDGEDGEGSGWGPEDQDEANGVAAPSEDPCSTWPPDADTCDSKTEKWDSRFVDDDGQIREHPVPEQSSHADSLDEEGPGPIGVPHDHLDHSEHSSDPEPFIPYTHLAANEPLPVSGGWKLKDSGDDGLEDSFSKGKSKEVRAYDEYKRGLRDGKHESWDPNVDGPEHYKKYDTDSDSEEEGEVRDEDLPFIRIPWSSAENDELLSQREDAQVVEIRVGDDETLESILRDISLRDERRQKGKGVEGRAECTREDVLGRKDVAASW